MLTSIDVKFIFNCLFIGTLREKGLFSSANILPTADVVPRVVLLMFLAMFFVNSSLISSSRNE